MGRNKAVWFGLEVVLDKLEHLYLIQKLKDQRKTFWFGPLIIGTKAKRFDLVCLVSERKEKNLIWFRAIPLLALNSRINQLPDSPSRRVGFYIYCPQDTPACPVFLSCLHVTFVKCLSGEPLNLPALADCPACLIRLSFYCLLCLSLLSAYHACTCWLPVLPVIPVPLALACLAVHLHYMILKKFYKHIVFFQHPIF